MKLPLSQFAATLLKSIPRVFETEPQPVRRLSRTIASSIAGRGFFAAEREDLAALWLGEEPSENEKLRRLFVYAGQHEWRVVPDPDAGSARFTLLDHQSVPRDQWMGHAS